MRAEESPKPLGLIGGNIEEIKRRSFRRQFIGELSIQIAVDLDDGDKQRDAKPQRKNDGRCQGAWPMNIGHGHAQAGCAGARCAARQDHHQGGDDAQEQKDGGSRGDIDQGDAAIIGQQNGEPGQNEYGEGSECDIPFAGPARLQLHHVAEQFGDRHIMRSSKRPQREDQRREQSVK